MSTSSVTDPLPAVSPSNADGGCAGRIDRASMVDRLVEDWIETIVKNGEVTIQHLLRQGHKGFDEMSDLAIAIEYQEISGDDFALEVCCPSCGSQRIASSDHVITVTNVASWSIDGGELSPQCSESGAKTYWDSISPTDEDKPYFCRDCDEDLAAADLKITLVEDFPQ